MEVVIVGSGAVGATLHLYLKNRHRVTLIARNRERRDQIAIHGIEVEDRVRGIRETIMPRVLAAEDVVEGLESVGAVDIVSIAVKAYDIENALNVVKRISGNPCVVTLQNGIEPYERSLQIFGNRAVHGVVTFGAYRPSLDRVVVSSSGKIYVGSYLGRTQCVDTVLQCLRDAEIDAEYVDNLRGWLWLKLLVNAAINPLTALLKIKNGVVAQSPLKELAIAIVEEGLEVVKRLGIELPLDPREVVIRIAKETGENISSMLQDVVACRRTEVDYINGVLIRYAEQLGLEAKLNRALYTLIKAVENLCFYHR